MGCIAHVDIKVTCCDNSSTKGGEDHNEPGARVIMECRGMPRGPAESVLWKSRAW